MDSSPDAGGGWGWGGVGRCCCQGNSGFSLGLVGQPHPGQPPQTWGWGKSPSERSMHPVPFTRGARAYTWARPLVGQRQSFLALGVGGLLGDSSLGKAGSPPGRGGSTSCRPRKQQSHILSPETGVNSLTSLAGQTHHLPSPLTSCDRHAQPDQPLPSGNVANLAAPAQGGGEASSVPSEEAQSGPRRPPAPWSLPAPVMLPG